jgi:hypothetical protein
MVSLPEHLDRYSNFEITGSRLMTLPQIRNYDIITVNASSPIHYSTGGTDYDRLRASDAGYRGMSNINSWTANNGQSVPMAAMPGLTAVELREWVHLMAWDSIIDREVTAELETYESVVPADRLQDFYIGLMGDGIDSYRAMLRVIEALRAQGLDTEADKIASKIFTSVDLRLGVRENLSKSNPVFKDTGKSIFSHYFQLLSLVKTSKDLSILLTNLPLTHKYLIQDFVYVTALQEFPDLFWEIYGPSLDFLPSILGRTSHGEAEVRIAALVLTHFRDDYHFIRALEIIHPPGTYISDTDFVRTRFTIASMVPYFRQIQSSADKIRFVKNVADYLIRGYRDRPFRMLIADAKGANDLIQALKVVEDLSSTLSFNELQSIFKSFWSKSSSLIEASPLESDTLRQFQDQLLKFAGYSRDRDVANYLAAHRADANLPIVLADLKDRLGVKRYRAIVIMANSSANQSLIPVPPTKWSAFVKSTSSFCRSLLLRPASGAST